MTGPGIVVGGSVGPFEGRLDAELVRRYAAATGDPSVRAQAGDTVPPVAIVTQIWEAENAARAALVPRPLQEAAAGGVHGEHDLAVHRPLLPGEPLRTWVYAHGSRPAGRNAVVTLRYVTRDAVDAVVVEQWWSTVYLGVTCDEVGERAPRHDLPEGARDRPVGEHVIDVDLDMARRYAEVSGDWSPHHFDVEAARRSGADRPFLHGLCTMALCAQAVARSAADEDPGRIRRLAVRFAAPMPLGESLLVRVLDVGNGQVAFEAECLGQAVIANGRADVAGPLRSA